jgi:hypothetical protein
LLKVIKVPHTFNRKPNDLNEVNNWKSSEIMLFLFYESIPLLLNTMSIASAVSVSNGIREPIKQHAFFYQYAAYIIAIRTLWEPIKSENDLKLADSIIKQYCKEIEETFDVNACLYTLHAHLHLVEQVKAHGPLNGHAQFFFEVIICSNRYSTNFW